VGGTDPGTNPRLGQELAHAKAGLFNYVLSDAYAENMSKDQINRAIARGGPRASGRDLVSLTFEVMLPGGVAMIVYRGSAFMVSDEIVKR